MTGPLRVAVIGLGWWGLNVLRTIDESADIEALVAVDPSPVAVEAAAQRGVPSATTLEEVLDDPAVEAVVLCTPHAQHARQIVAAARRGRHVYCEKPLAPTQPEARAAVAAVQAAGVVLAVGHERRFEPAVLHVRGILDAGDLGTALVVEGNFSQDKFLDLPSTNWRLSAQDAPVGPLSATGIHLVDLAIAVLGQPETVWARLSDRGAGFANGDTLSVMISFASGATASVTAVLATPFIGRFAIFGSVGWAEIRDRSHPEASTGWDVTIARRGKEIERLEFAAHSGLRSNLEAFATAVRGGAQYPIPLEQMIAGARAFEAIVRSTRSGRIEAC